MYRLTDNISYKVFLTLNFLIKVSVVLLVLLPLIYPHLPQYQGKAMGVRMIMYPVATLVVPFLWLILSKGRSYPHKIDILFVLPFLIDTLGNSLNFYNTTDYFDRYAHFLNWLLITTAFGSAISTLNISRLNVLGLSIGFGSVTHILWEIGEYVVMMMGASGLQLTYNDTIDDLILSFLGTLTGSILVVTLLWKARLMPVDNT